ncbi:MAG: LysR family transcriptional regulator [Proteobacteria bacterium]|nr:LysR family transcriptional regulator [Pseudomonadota bacterium]
MRRLPPLAAVRVFEAAARHDTFTAAATELGMTQAAVSYQIKLLEERLGLPLFHREGRRAILTEAGRRIAPSLTQAFDAIDASFSQLRTESQATLTVSTTPTFANTWLAWRIGGFQMQHPDLAVRMVVGDDLTDFTRDEADVAIRSGPAPWPDLLCERLLEIDFTPMCSPQFLARHGPLQPADLLDLQTIIPQDNWRDSWLAAAGVTIPQQPARPGVQLDSQANEGNAAMAGQGIALLTPYFWRNDVAEGRLVRPFDLVASQGYAYWLVMPQRGRATAKIRRFREWLLAEIGEDLSPQ